MATSGRLTGWPSTTTEVLVALAINEVPTHWLAARLHSTPGALYKTLHDARARLREELHQH